MGEGQADALQRHTPMLAITTLHLPRRWIELFFERGANSKFASGLSLATRQKS
jgi:hypothetical protein